jgi:hypothetical protein
LHLRLAVISASRIPEDLHIHVDELVPWIRYQVVDGAGVLTDLNEGTFWSEWFSIMRTTRCLKVAAIEQLLYGRRGVISPRCFGLRR